MSLDDNDKLFISQAIQLGNSPIIQKVDQLKIEVGHLKEQNSQLFRFHNEDVNERLKPKVNGVRTDVNWIVGLGSGLISLLIAWSAWISYEYSELKAAVKLLVGGSQ